MKSVPITLVSLAFALLSLAHAAPAQSVGQSQRADAKEREARSTKKIVRPGQMHCNQDGVCVTNNSTGTDNATVDPRTGTANSATMVDTDSDFRGEIDGIDSNDAVDLGSNNTVTVTGSGGSVELQGGSTVTVQNTNPPGGSGDITVTLNNGTTATIGPASNVTFHT